MEVSLPKVVTNRYSKITCPQVLVLVDLPKKNEGDHERYSDSSSIYPQTKVERERGQVGRDTSAV